MAPPTTLVWFRRDLRVDDHRPLAEAAGRGGVVCLFVVDPALLARRHHRAPARLRFLRASLAALDDELRTRGARLVVRHGAPDAVVPAAAAEAGADLVVAHGEITPLGRARDARVATALEARGIGWRTLGTGLLAEPGQLPGPGGAGYRVFTPFHRRWSETPLPGHVPCPPLHGPALAGIDPADVLPAGEPPMAAGPAAARSRLVAAIRDGVADAYDGGRDRLDRDGTTRLGADLRFGALTTAQVGRALGLPGAVSGGRRELWRQLAWREFFHHVLANHPEAARAAFQPKYRTIRWDPPDLFGAWTAGRTGVPVVDAAMRQLASTGWMHNRARMIAASFLVKDLLIDWRRGETWFMRHLVDGDPASNNGGWQWVAGTGTDAAPYFRVLNPVRQGLRFDPDGAYVRRWVPELARVPAGHVHEPWTMDEATQVGARCRIGIDYPAPVVDHRERRETVLARYRDAGGSS